MNEANFHNHVDSLINDIHELSRIREKQADAAEQIAEGIETLEEKSGESAPIDATELRDEAIYHREYTELLREAARSLRHHQSNEDIDRAKETAKVVQEMLHPDEHFASPEK